MTAPTSDPGTPAATGGVARAHRGLTLLFLVLGVVQFFLAGLGTFGEGFDAHRGAGAFMVLLSLILLVLALAGRRQALTASAVLFGLMILQSILANVGEDAPVIGALHPLNGLLVLAVASLAAAGKPVRMPARG